MSSQVVEDEPDEEQSHEYYQESYSYLRPSVPDSRDGRMVVGAILVTIAAFTVQALLPAGTPPNSVEPWVGPLPFSFAWLFFWAFVLQGLMIVAYVKFTGEGE